MNFRRCLSISLIAISACKPEDEGPQWQMVYSELDGALLSVWGTAADDVWAVGSDPGDGPYFLHYDGAAFERLPTGETGNLWWVTSDGETLWACGEGGLVLRGAGDGSGLERVATPTTEPLFGIYGFGPDDAWAVGGQPDEQTAVILHWDGSEFIEVPLPAEAAGATPFKVWGAASDDVWITGYGGVALHWDGTAFATLTAPPDNPLFTVHGVGDDVVAVGGSVTGVIVDVSLEALVDQAPFGTPRLNGVFVTAETAIAGGERGAVFERTAGTWTQREDAPAIPRDYHSVYVDPEGGIWAVGGQILAAPFSNGVLAHYGGPIEGGWTE